MDMTIPREEWRRHKKEDSLRQEGVTVVLDLGFHPVFVRLNFQVSGDASSASIELTKSCQNI